MVVVRFIAKEFTSVCKFLYSVDDELYSINYITNTSFTCPWFSGNDRKLYWRNKCWWAFINNNNKCWYRNVASPEQASSRIHRLFDDANLQNYLRIFWLNSHVDGEYMYLLEVVTFIYSLCFWCHQSVMSVDDDCQVTWCDYNSCSCAFCTSYSQFKAPEFN